MRGDEPDSGHVVLPRRGKILAPQGMQLPRLADVNRSFGRLIEPSPRRLPKPRFTLVSFDVANLKIGKVAANNPIRVKRSPTLRTKDCDPGAVIEFDEGAVRPAADVDAFWRLHVEPPFDFQMGAQGQSAQSNC
jgi:hypothetical protein